MPPSKKSQGKRKAFGWDNHRSKQQSINRYGKQTYNTKSHKKVAFFRCRPILYNGVQTGNNEVQYITDFAEKDQLEELFSRDKVRLMAKKAWTGEYNRMRVQTHDQVQVMFELAKALPTTGAQLQDTIDMEGSLPFPELKIPIVSTTYEGIESIFLTDTYCLQEHLEDPSMGFVYNMDVNGLKGHIKAKSEVDMQALIGLLDKFGYSHEEFDE